MDTTDIEKKSLEAHVELCAERYKLLELKLETLESNVDSLSIGQPLIRRCLNHAINFMAKS